MHNPSYINDNKNYKMVIAIWPYLIHVSGKGQTSESEFLDPHLTEMAILYLCNKIQL